MSRRRLKPSILCESILTALNTPARIYAMSCAMAAAERAK